MPPPDLTVRNDVPRCEAIIVDSGVGLSLYSDMAIHYETPLDRTFRALGDETRRRMIAMLATEGAMSAGELGAPFGVAQPTTSKHLKVLERAGLVTREIAGRTHRFRLALEALDDAQDWIATHKTFWEGTLARLGAHLDDPD